MGGTVSVDAAYLAALEYYFQVVERHRGKDYGNFEDWGTCRRPQSYVKTTKPEPRKAPDPIDVLRRIVALWDARDLPYIGNHMEDARAAIAANDGRSASLEDTCACANPRCAGRSGVTP